MLQGILMLVTLYLWWLSFFCYGFYRGSIRAKNPMESAESIGGKIFLAGAVFYILHFFFGGIVTLLEIPTAIQESGIQLFLIIITALLILFISSGIPGYIIGYFIVKGSNKPKVS